MSPKDRLRRIVGRLGYEVHKHPAVRRVRLLNAFGIDLVLDGGAASGGYASDLRRHGYGGRIVSFEPLEAAFEQLSRRAGRDPRWVAVRCALGDVAAERTIYLAGNSDSSSFLPMLPRHNEAAPHAAYVGVEQVDVRRLDDFLPSFIETSERPFLKLDVQGYEQQVLAGAVETIDRAQGVQVEVSFVPLYEHGPMYHDVLEDLRRRGFSVVQIEPGFLDVESGQLLQADVLLMRLPEG